MIRMGKGILSKEISGYIHATKIIAVWQKGRANKGQDDATWGQKKFYCLHRILELSALLSLCGNAQKAATDGTGVGH